MKDRTHFEHLERIRKLVSEGWIQQQYSYNGSFCLLGACRRVASGGFDSDYDRLVSSLYGSIPVKGDRAEPIPASQALVAFNDAKGRTKEEVLAVVDKSIEKALNRETIDGLQIAARLLVDVGWVQDFMIAEDEKGQPCGYCLKGAVFAASHKWYRRLHPKPKPVKSGNVMADLRYRMFEALRAAAVAKMGCATDPFVDWLVMYNDEPGRTHDDILAVVNDAIANVGEGRDIDRV